MDRARESNLQTPECKALRATVCASRVGELGIGLKQLFSNPQNGNTNSCIFCIVVVTKQERTTPKPTPTHSTVSPKDNGTTKTTMDTTRVTNTTQVTTLPNCPAGHAESGGCGGTFVGGMVLGLCIPIALYIVFFCWRRRQSRVKFRNSLSVRADE